mgnify:FL=1
MHFRLPCNQDSDNVSLRTANRSKLHLDAGASCIVRRRYSFDYNLSARTMNWACTLAIVGNSPQGSKTKRTTRSGVMQAIIQHLDFLGILEQHSSGIAVSAARQLKVSHYR